MVKLKGQFMLVSAIIVTLLLLTTATTMTELQQGTHEPMEQGYYIDSVHDLGEQLDLGKKSDRKKFKESLNYINDYSINLNYWETNRCYNVTLSNSEAELKMRCVGNGSAFHDSFEDGEYKNPTWTKTTGAGNAAVRTTYGPADGNQALLLSENQTGDTLKIRWERNLNVWNQEWRAEGLFYTEELNSSALQEQNILFYDQSSGTAGLKLQLGFSSSSGQLPVRIEGSEVNSPGTGTITWSEDAWYHWNITHDGGGNYEANVWREDGSDSVSVTASGNALGNQARNGAITISGDNGEAFKIRHDFLKVQNE